MEYLLKPALFLLGGSGYVGLELLWRGRSHPSMFLAGGVCFLLLGWLRKRMFLSAPYVRCITGAIVITGVELVTGLLFNQGYGVWDYRNLPVNFLGQISLVYSLLWIPVSLGGMELYRFLERRLRRFA